MIEGLSGRGIFVFSDPGGAKPLLSLINKVEAGLSDFRIISDRKYSFYDDFSLKVENIRKSPLSTLREFSADFVFTGTSYTSTIELQYLEAAAQLSIYSYSFVDHWTFIRERFLYNNTEILPNEIFVVDNEAREGALAQGLPGEIVKVLGNPYHEYLESWYPTKTRKDLLISLGLNFTNKRIIVYAPDPLSNINGISLYGFDEVLATKWLNNLSESLSDEYLLIVKPHPNQNIELLKNILNEKSILVSSNVDVNTLIFYSDTVIGFFSSFLIEASIMDKSVVRLLPRDVMNDPFANKSIGRIAYPDTISSLFN